MTDARHAEEQRFRAAIPKSWEAVWCVAKHLQHNGCTVQVPPMTIRDSISDRAGHGDDYDLSVLQNYEVKWRKLNFTNASDYPYRTIFVDRVDKVDKVGAAVSAYIIVNAGLTHALRIARSTKDKWITSARQDSTKGYGFTVYECPVEQAMFFALEGNTH